MTVNWEFAYIYGPYAVLLAFLQQHFPDASAPKGYTMPLDIHFKGNPQPAMKQTGTQTVNGHTQPTYGPIEGNTNVLVLVAAHNGGLHLYDKLGEMSEVKVHKGATPEQIKALYPEHCLFGVPHTS